MKEDVGMSKPKKHAKQGWEANIGQTTVLSDIGNM